MRSRRMREVYHGKEAMPVKTGGGRVDGEYGMLKIAQLIIGIALLAGITAFVRQRYHVVIQKATVDVH